MADDELRWRRQHVHEASVVSYGHFGADRYDEYGRQWSFIRESNGGLSSPDGQSSSDQFRVLYDDTLCDASDITLTRQSSSGSRGYPRSLQLLGTGIRDRDLSPTNVSHRGQTTAALYGSLAQYDHNIRGSVLAFVSGHAQDQLSIVPLERTKIRFRSLNDNLIELAVPTATNRISVFWQSHVGSILQLEHSVIDSTSKRISYLAVRCASATQIFEAVGVGQADAFLSRSSRLPVDATREPVLTLSASVTGSSHHADCAWHPDNARQIGLVDVQGNWSVWTINGRNAHTAKVLYQAQLQCCGKLFSWSEKTRPDETGVYFDGWHKIVWTSSDGGKSDRVLVSNRQMMKMFDFRGAETSRLDPRLGHRKEKDFILDVKVVRLKIVIVLTTSKVVVFDSSKTDWKDKNRPSSVAMLCIVEHGYSPHDLELSMTLAEYESLFLLMLYTNKGASPSLRKFHVTERSSCTSVTATDSIPLSLLPLRDNVSSIALRPLETLVLHLDDKGTPCVFSILVTYKDRSIKAFIVDFGIQSDAVSQLGQSSDLVRLPQKKSRIRTKSSLYVNETDDLLDFVEPDVYIRSQPRHVEIFRRDTDKRRHLNETALTRIRQYLTLSPVKNSNISQAIGQIVDVLSAISTDELEFTAGTLTDISPSDSRVEDIDADSTRIEEFHAALTTRYSRSFRTLTIPNHSGPSLLETYEELFRTHIESLSAAVPGRVRLNRERQLRDLALDLNLASCVIVPAIRSETHDAQLSPSHQPDDPIENQKQAIHSEPLQAPIPPLASSPEPRIVATQTQSQNTTSHPQAPPPQHPHIQSALSRLSAYTPITLPQNLPTSTNSIINPILAHLPFSSDIFPTTYDYTATEFDLNVKHRAQNATAAEREVERKRAEKISRARDKAAKRLKVVNERGAIPTIGTMLVGDGGGSVLGRDGGHVLPIRGVQSSQVFGSGGGGGGGGEEAGSSQNQSQGVPGISMTQPEAGVFGQRRATVKAKGKNKRRAGF